MNRLAPAGAAVVLGLALAPAPPAAGAGDDGTAREGGASFVDRFDSLRSDRWFVSDGWANGPHQRCLWSARNLAIETPGTLQLKLVDRPMKDRSQTCAEVQSRARYGFGTYEVRMRAPAASGLVTAFFTYTGPRDDGPHDEIDFEVLGKDPSRVQLNWFAAGEGSHEAFADVPGGADRATTDYAVQWLPDRIRWFSNGKLVHEAVQVEGKPFPQHRSKIFMSIWNGQGSAMDPWLGPSGTPAAPLIASVERVAFTRLGEPCAFQESVACGPAAGR